MSPPAPLQDTARALANGGHIRPLTSLRFFAAFWVVLYHYWPKLAVNFTPAIVDKGYLGVELFFILSGFILCHVYLSSVEDGRFRYADFLWARLARVYPLHIVTLIGFGLMAGAAMLAGFVVDPNIVSLAALPANLTLTQAWGLAPVAGWNHPSWSISAEWLAYLSFPLFAFAAIRLRARPYLAVAGALAFMTALYAGFQAITGQSLTHATIAWGALRIVPCFAYGCALYLMWRASAADRRRIALAGAFIFGAGIALGAQFGAPDALIVAAFGGLLLSLAQLARSGSGLAGSPVLVYLGEISYAVYMVCIPWQWLFDNATVKILHLSGKQLPLLAWIAMLVTVIPLAALTHHMVERPSRERMKLWWTSRSGHKLATVNAG